jgi:O-antigen/teichoic acid export membrane protein
MQPANRVIKNTGILYAKMGITMFISLYTTRLILNALGANDFGIFNIVGGSIAMLGFLNASMAGATQRFMSFAEGVGDTKRQISIFNVSIILHFLIAIFIGIALLGMGYFFFNGILNIPEDRIDAAKLVYFFMIVSTMFTIMTVPYDAVLNAHENMLYFSLVGIIESVLKLSVAIVIVFTSSDKLIIYGLLMACISLFIMVIMRIYTHRKYTECIFAPTKFFDKNLMKEMTGFAGWNFLGSASSIIAGYGSGIVLNHFHGTILNAANGIAGQINGQLLVFSNTMQKALNPIIAKSEGGGNRELMIKATLTGSKFSFLIFAFFCIPFLIETPFILKFWLKNVPEWTVIFCRLAIVYTLIEQISITLGTAISAVGIIKKFKIYSSIVVILNFVALYIIFKLGFKPYFMPIIAILVGITITLMKLYYANKLCGITYIVFFREVFNRILLVFTLSLSIGLIPIFFMQPTFVRFLYVCLLSTSSYLIFSLLFAFSPHEMRIINDLKSTIISRLKDRLHS